MTIDHWLKTAQSRLKDAGVKSSRLDSLLLLEHVLELDRSSLLARPENILKHPDIATLDSLLERRCKREPIAYLVGHRQFYGLDFIVNNKVLIPRPETETLVEYVLKNAPEAAKLVDVGSGCGNIAISIKHNRPDIEVLASDISEKALFVAAKNQRKHQINITLKKRDLLRGSSGQYDVIIANLPYVVLDKIPQSPELEYEPALALFADEDDGLSLYRKIFSQAKKKLADGGFLVIEHDKDQFHSLQILALDNGFKLLDRISDFVTSYSQS